MAGEPIGLSRRRFLYEATRLGFTAAGLPLLAGCGRWGITDPTPGPTKVARLAWLSGRESTTTSSPLPVGVTRELVQRDLVEGQHFTVEVWKGSPERLPEIAAELVRQPIAVILVFDAGAAVVAKQATSTIPIVISANDPVGERLIDSLARPGGNVTGYAGSALPVVPKRLELLKETLPGLTRSVFLVNERDPLTPRLIVRAKERAAALGVELRVVDVQSADDAAKAFEMARQWSAEGLFLMNSPTFEPLFSPLGNTLVELQLEHRLPAVFSQRQQALAGGLMVFGDPLGLGSENVKVMARAVDLILKGTKPSDIPVEQAIPTGLIINLKTAQAFGLTVPQTVLAQASELIQ
ncbi:MAG: ABC transporter substrate-binding protein [Chloroflexi bacterium]|nr:ABC transporter substrate-binding protein [Chloroflexota bacterium]